jgi:hypothetical protein
MNNERYNQIIDEVYNKYLQFKKENITNTQWDIILDSYIYDGDVPIKPGTVLGHYTGRMCTKEELIEKIRSNKDWSERWGLKIEERELSLEERSLIANSNHYEVSLNIKGIGVDGDVTLHTHLDELNIPTKLITLLYSNETIEVYE